MESEERQHYFNFLRGLMGSDKLADDYRNSHLDHHYFDMFQLTFQCPAPVNRYPGGNIDGGKYACNLDYMPKPCLVYSIGSEGNYFFEEEMVKFGCEVHTFDCFGDYGTNAPLGVTFHKWCAGGEDQSPYYTIPTMMKMLGHDRIDFLKMDIESAEYQALPTLESLPKSKRPVQIACEIHQNGNGMWTGGGLRQREHLRQTVNLMLQMESFGYRLMTREDNMVSPCCSEFVHVIPEYLWGPIKA